MVNGQHDGPAIVRFKNTRQAVFHPPVQRVAAFESEDCTLLRFVEIVFFPSCTSSRSAMINFSLQSRILRKNRRKEARRRWPLHPEIHAFFHQGISRVHTARLSLSWSLLQHAQRGQRL